MELESEREMLATRWRSCWQRPHSRWVRRCLRECRVGQRERVAGPCASGCARTRCCTQGQSGAATLSPGSPCESSLVSAPFEPNAYVPASVTQTAIFTAFNNGTTLSFCLLLPSVIPLSERPLLCSSVRLLCGAAEARDQWPEEHDVQQRLGICCGREQLRHCHSTCCCLSLTPLSTHCHHPQGAVTNQLPPLSPSDTDKI